MEINFTNSEIIFIYGHFRKEANKLKAIKDAPDCPISKDNLNQDIDLYTSIADKLLDAYPGLGKFDKFKL